VRVYPGELVAMSVSFDVIVIGAGIVGAACACECASAGMRVAVIERGTIGGDATAAGMGHIVVMDDSPAQFALTRYSQLLWHELRQQLPREVEYENSGTLWIARDEEELEAARLKHQFYAAQGIAAEMLDQQALLAAEPQLSPSLVGGLVVSEDVVVYPPAAAYYLARKAQELGAVLFLEKNVARAKRGNVFLDDGTTVHAERIVLATGAEAARLLPGVAVRKRKGHLLITDRYPGFVRHQLVELGYLKSAHSIAHDSVAFNLQPRQTGQLLLGSSRQYDAEDTAVDRSIVRKMIDRAAQYVPAIATQSVLRLWTGFRAATPDKLPLIGPVSQDPTLFLATGHEGLGITTSLGTARLLTDHFLGRPSAIAREPYLPSRLEGVAYA
jgi:D-hydroxyproline dehydrogenase subunit beta